jgi:hypothetical protein
MNKYIKAIVLCSIITCSYTTQAQTASADIVPSVESGILVEKPVAPAVIIAKEVTLSLRNACEKGTFVYAGNKTNLYGGKGQHLGGLSNNTLYLYEGDVVCIMKDSKTTQACSIIKPGVNKVEINPSGNGFVKQ